MVVFSHFHFFPQFFFVVCETESKKNCDNNFFPICDVHVLVFSRYSDQFQWCHIKSHHTSYQKEKFTMISHDVVGWSEMCQIFFDKKVDFLCFTFLSCLFLSLSLDIFIIQFRHNFTISFQRTHDLFLDTYALFNSTIRWSGLWKGFFILFLTLFWGKTRRDGKKKFFTLQKITKRELFFDLLKSKWNGNFNLIWKSFSFS